MAGVLRPVSYTHLGPSSPHPASSCKAFSESVCMPDPAGGQVLQEMCIRDRPFLDAGPESVDIPRDVFQF